MRYVALFIGVNSAPNASQLRFAESDAVQMFRLFTSNLAFGTMRDSSVLLGSHATRSAVRHALTAMRRQAPDCVLIFFSGHGSPHGIALADGIFAHNELAARLDGIGAERPVVIIDACHAGAATRPFLTRFGGVGGLLEDVGPAWIAAVNSAALGLRFYAAVADGANTHEDSLIGGGRFSWCLRRALRFARGRSFGQYAWVTDIDAFAYAADEMQSRWPEEPMPLLLRPNRPGFALPLVLAQSEHPIGNARITSVAAARGASVSVTILTKGRQFVPTFFQARVFDVTGRQLGSTTRERLPRYAATEFSEVFSLPWGALEKSSDVFSATLFGQPFSLTWELSVIDDFDRTVYSRVVQYLHEARVHDMSMTG